MKKIKYHLFILLMISIFTLSIIPGCIPDLADVSPPIVEIAHPANDAVVNGVTQVIASASDDGELRSLNIYIDGRWVISSATGVAVYEWDTAPFADNLQHYISAVAVDMSDNVGAAPVVNVTVVAGQNTDIEPPTVVIVNPLNDQVVSGNVNIVAEATDNAGVDRVEFYIDGLLEDTASTPPYIYLWNTALTNAGVHTIFARAFDTNNNSDISEAIAVTVDTTFDDIDPVVTILNPIEGQIVSGNVNIVAEATDNVEVDRVEFYIDGLLETTVNNRPFDYLWNTASVDSGVHTIFVRAYDTSNNTAASPTISVTVDSTLGNVQPGIPPNHRVTRTLAMGNASPKIDIVSPERTGLFFSETETKSIPIKVTSTSGAAVERVEFYIDGTLHKVVTNATNDLFRYDWNIERFGDGGLHSIFVKAFDTSSNSTADMIVVRVYP